MSDRTDPEQQVAAALQTATEHTDVPTAGIDAARHRGNTRHRRRRLVVGTASVVVLAASAVTVWQLTDPAARDTISPATPNLTTPDTLPPQTTTGGFYMPPGSSEPGTPVQRIEPSIVWNLVTPGSAEAVSSRWWTDGSVLQSGSTPLLVWSTAPAGSPVTAQDPVLYRSDDGIHWTPVATSNLANTARPLATAAGDVLFSYSTTAAAGALHDRVGEPRAAASSDGGATWTDLDLPIDLTEVATGANVQRVNAEGRVAGRGDTTVLLVNVEPVWVDATGRRLLAGPAGATSYDGGGPMISLAEAGIDLATVAVAQQPRAFVIVGGTDVSEATFPALPDDFLPAPGVFNLSVSDAGFLATFPGMRTDGTGQAPSFAQLVYTSIDGRAWQLKATIDNAGGALTMLPDGTLVEIRYDAGPGVAFSADGATWQRYSLLPLLDEEDGSTATIGIEYVHVGETGITLTGFVSTPDGFVSSGPAHTTRVVLHSSDGVHWSRQNLADIVGSPEAVGRYIDEVDGTLLITVIEPSGQPGVIPPITRVLVGTPTT